MLDESKRQRAMRPEVAISRRAIVVVQPVNRRIGGWQIETARLAALGQRALISGRSTVTIRADLARLSESVRAEIESFDECASQLPAAVGRSGRIHDTHRALHQMSGAIDTALRGLGIDAGATSPG